MPSAFVPSATYRLQLNGTFTFDAASRIVDYLDALGVSHCYTSSYLQAVPGSTHGYDVTDPSRLNPEIGDESAYWRWVETLRRHGMGHILDLVPNHMGIARSANPWWQDVLENGPSSRYARDLRYRLASTEAGAGQQGAAADPRQLLRRDARAPGDCGSSTRKARSVCVTRITCCRSRRAPTTRFSEPKWTPCSRRWAPRATKRSSS